MINNIVSIKIQKVTQERLVQTGGNWLRTAREFLQRHVKNGDTVTWGSGEVLNITAKQVEDMAVEIATAAINEYIDDINIQVDKK